jgi:hypothetical protein
LFERLKALYDGYAFNESYERTLFNPTMIFFYLRKYLIGDNEEPTDLLDPNILSGYSNIESLARLSIMDPNPAVIKADFDARTACLMDAIAQEPINEPLCKVFTLNRFTCHEFVSQLFYMGYLTIRNSYGKIGLVIPNAVMQQIFEAYFLDMIIKLPTFIDPSEMKKALDDIADNGDNTGLVDYLRKFLSLAVHHNYANFVEKHFQIAAFSLFRKYSGLVVENELPVSSGFVNLSFLPLIRKPREYYAAIELKYFSKSEIETMAIGKALRSSPPFPLPHTLF